MGIARQIRDGMCLIDGLSADEANRRFWCVDRNGLLVESVSFSASSRALFPLGWFQTSGPITNPMILILACVFSNSQMGDSLRHSQLQYARPDTGESFLLFYSGEFSTIADTGLMC